MALLENPKHTNDKVTKNTEVEAKRPAVKKRDKKLKCEPPARCSVKKKASGGDYDSGGVFKRFYHSQLTSIYSPKDKIVKF